MNNKMKVAKWGAFCQKQGQAVKFCNFFAKLHRLQSSPISVSVK
jgi:hypothetical protein